MTINDKANRAIDKAIHELNKALTELENTPAYQNKSDIFHASTVSAVNAIITAINKLNDL
jgi:hypothetical protein